MVVSAVLEVTDAVASLSLKANKLPSSFQHHHYGDMGTFIERNRCNGHRLTSFTVETLA